jgi:D-glycero-D-manno-heptose 1,7-bisphosphate phosphatase
MKRAIFLDRDGVLSKTKVINGKSFAPRTFKNFKLFSYSASSVKKLKTAGFMVFVITNQPDVGKKLISKIVLKKMHNKLKKKTHVDKIYTCTHKQDENCYCRKPRPGMILHAAKKYQINLKNSFLIGDRATDIEAGNRVKCRTIFLDKKYREKYPTKQEATFINLNEATKYILKSVKNVKH